MQHHIKTYADKLSRMLKQYPAPQVQALGEGLREAWQQGRSVFLCGNGGSAGNAIHLANDWLYGVGTRSGGGLRVEALSANQSVITCLGNDIGYDQIYAEQIKVKARSGDILIVLSGSGNSPNVVKALETGNSMGLKTFAILGFSGGKCKDIAQYPIHFAIDDMQVSEDLQMIVGHVCMQWLYSKGKA